ncbi:MAG: sugar transferase [Acidobacteria bacterium]|nr:MAG: sugar transferase [Acidobacteriota bacterium]REK01465.1 MAG: sugar transferase [Acidobacteriota bacterium]REK14421.1 MAG: sugar transferase [Acidobacteriota bacterium]REK45136.1 MAG: sugar transferase [Acidobacteriota bacterium]
MKKRARSIPRQYEVALACFGLVVISPLLFLAAVLIKLGSRGPVLFRQERVGLNGKKFTMFKLRTMTVAKSGPKITSADDVRVTFVGRYLRRSKVDELPELWNVLRGDMSFVGPRPEVPEFVDLNDPEWVEVLEHRPGITDPVTLRLRNEEALLARVTDKERFYREVIQPYKLRGYLRFVRDKSWKTDLRIGARTVWAVAFPATVKPPSKEELQWSFAE